MVRDCNVMLAVLMRSEANVAATSAGDLITKLVEPLNE